MTDTPDTTDPEFDPFDEEPEQEPEQEPADERDEPAAAQEQGTFAGMEGIDDEVLNRAILNYELWRDKRIAAGREEKKAYDEMVNRAFGLGLGPNIKVGQKEQLVYVMEDADGIPHELTWAAEPKLKAKAIKDGADAEG